MLKNQVWYWKNMMRFVYQRLLSDNNKNMALPWNHYWLKSLMEWDYHSLHWWKLTPWSHLLLSRGCSEGPKFQGQGEANKCLYQVNGPIVPKNICLRQFLGILRECWGIQLKSLYKSVSVSWGSLGLTQICRIWALPDSMYGVQSLWGLGRAL